MIAHHLEDVVVRVPAELLGLVVSVLAAVAVIPDHVDQRHAGFDQSSREQTGLAGSVPAIAVAQGGRFRFDVECVACFRAVEPLKCLPVQRLHIEHRKRSRGSGLVGGCFE